MGAFGTLGSGRGLWARRVPGSEPGVQAEARGRARPSVGRKPLSDHQCPGEWCVSGGAGARRPRAGGCARSRLCRRSGRNHSCSRSARSCTAARAGSALGTRLCLVVGVTGVDLARARAPEPHRPLSSWSGWVLQDPTPTAAPPTSPLLPAARSPTQRAREASSWKPPGHSHTAPPGRGTQRPLTQRHSSESSSELSSSAPARRTGS